MADAHVVAGRHLDRRLDGRWRRGLRVAAIAAGREFVTRLEGVRELSRARGGRHRIPESTAGPIPTASVALFCRGARSRGGFRHRVGAEQIGREVEHPGTEGFGAGMSLDEQALNRLRNSARAPAARAAETAPHVAAAAPVIDAVGATGRVAKRLSVDIGALRAAGCIAEESQGPQFAAQYREIKRPLIEAALSGKAGEASREPQLVMVTSALPGDGKTFTSINLALSMTRERDLSVLLVDADVQKSDISELFGLKPQRGLLDALVDETIDVESLTCRTNLPGLCLLPSGTPVESATELLSSKRMQHIAGSLIAGPPRRIVLFDCPPLLITSEARAL